MTVWLSRAVVEVVHSEQLAQHGGGSGLRDAGLLDSALARPLHHSWYGDPDIPALAALNAIGICKNHPFIDGNRRTAYVALETTLAINGYGFPVTDAEAVVAMLDMAAGELTEAEFIAWVRDHARSLTVAVSDLAG